MDVLRKATFVVALGAPIVAQGESKAEPGAQAPAKPAPQYAKIAVEKTQLRCFASTKSPHYEDALVQGQVVQIGDKVGDFREVTVPLGPTGYVHKKFSSAPDKGLIAATGNNVSFRYRPRGSEVPVMVMPKGTKLHFLGEEGEWWKVTHGAATSYLPESDLQVLPDQDPVAEAGLRKLEAARRQTWTDAVAKRDSTIAEAAARRVTNDKLDVLDAAMGEQMRKPVGQRAFEGVERELAPLLAELTEGTPEHARAAQIQVDIEKQRLLARAVHVVEEEPPTQNRTAELIKPEVHDALSRFDAVGWLRRDRNRRTGETFYLYKGGVHMYTVTCQSRRYDLWMFDGAEVGIQGAKSRPAVDRVRELDVLKLEVLQLPR